MNTVTITPLGSQGSPGHSPSLPVPPLPSGTPATWREIAQDVLGAIVVSSVIAGLAYLYWAA